MIGGVWPEEIDPHPCQLLSAIVREGLDAFVVETPLVLPAKHHAEFRFLRQAPRSFLQFDHERTGIFAEAIVKKSNLSRRPRTDWPARQGQFQRARLPHQPRQRIGPIFRSVELTHAPVMGVEDDANLA